MPDRFDIRKPNYLAAVLVSILAVATATSGFAQSSERVALITDLSGTVEVASRSAAFAKASWGTPLYEGDQVKTLADAEASILFSNGNLITLGQNASMTIGAAAGASGDAGRVRDVSGEYLADASDLTLYRAGRGEIGALGGLRTAGSADRIELRTPRNTRVKAARPELVWMATGDFDYFTVKVLSEEGALWSVETESTSATYPDDAPALLPGKKYYWQVVGEVMLNTVSSPLVSFEVLSHDERVEVERHEAAIKETFADEPGSANHLYVLGTYYANQDLLGNAIAAFAAIAERHPDAAPAFEILGKLYYEVDLKDEAIAALQKAVELERKE